MSQFLIAVVDGMKARFLTLELAEMPESETSPRLIEHQSLANPEQEMQGQELWSSSKTGRNRGTAGQSHSYDDHRQNHLIEFERRFAQTIATQILNLAQVHQVQKLLLIAEPQILGLMRETLTPILPKALKMTEMAKDLRHLTPQELHEYLAGKKLLPYPKRASRLP